MGQVDRLLALLEERGERGVTPLYALEQIGTMRLAARVHDLRSAGFNIIRLRETTPSRKVVARYVLRPRVQTNQVSLWSDES